METKLSKKAEVPLEKIEKMCQELKEYCCEINNLAEEIGKAGCVVEFKVITKESLGSLPNSMVFPKVTKVIVSDY